MNLAELIGVEEYDDFTRDGTSCYVKALRLGRGHWRVELMRWAIYIRCGSVEWTCGFAWAVD